MWGMDSHGLRTLSQEEVDEIVQVGAFLEFSRTHSDLELFKFAFPFQSKVKKNPKTGKNERLPQSKKSLMEFAKQGALKWGNLPVLPDELEVVETTNQDFVVLSIGKKRREIVFFRD